MDKFEQTLAQAIDLFIALQKWSAEPEESRRPKEVFPIIIDLDKSLKDLRRLDKTNPLQELAEEVRKSCSTPEFRAILLAAFNWRSASEQKVEIPEDAVSHNSVDRGEISSRKSAALSSKKIRKPKGRKSTSKITKKSSPIAVNPKRGKERTANTERFIREVSNYINSIPEETRRRLLAPEEYVDIYRAGRRVDGSYGSTQ